MFAASKTASVAADGGYQISRSLRFNSADNAYLSRTPASSSSKTTWTFSTWVKRSALNNYQTILSAGQSGSSVYLVALFFAENQLDLAVYGSGGAQEGRVTSTAVYRDMSAWYHVMAVLDTTNATPANRLKLYINGSQITTLSVASYPTQNSIYAVNSTDPHFMGTYSYGTTLNKIDGYQTETYLIDGQALTPSSFGETNAQTGVWQPKAYSGAYGTNGFYLNFSDNSNTTAATLGKDYSGNGNNWTPNGFLVSAGVNNDSLVDSPTSYGTDTGVGGTVRGNYATLNPLLAVNNTAQTYSNGNLQITDNGSGSTSGFGVSTIDMPSGKWYVEATVTAIGTGATFGIWQLPILATTTFSSQTNYRWYSVDGVIYNASGATGNSYATWTTNDVLSVAVNMDAGSVTFYKNGTSQGSAITGLTGSWVVGFNAGGSNTIFNANFGQRPFAYTAPSGFKALCTQNLPTPTIGATTATTANKFFDVNRWAGNGSSQSITNGGFQPDWVWTKTTNTAQDARLVDSVRGVSKAIYSQLANAEATESTGITSFDSSGFSVGSGSSNSNAASYVGWQWKGGGSGSTNTAGSITSTVSASTTSGFSVVTWTNPASGVFTFGHGLGVAPSMVFLKDRQFAVGWTVYHIGIGNTGAVFLNTNGAVSISSGYFNNTSPTSTVFTANQAGIGTAGANMVAYCFAPVAGYSTFGTYTGNASLDGPFVYCGFRPRFVMMKRYDTSGTNWQMYDTSANPYNVTGNYQTANLSNAEEYYATLDILSNGFRLKNVDGGINGSGNTYIFAAFAESPFKYSLAR
jgi:hypothetical protein